MKHNTTDEYCKLLEETYLSLKKQREDVKNAKERRELIRYEMTDLLEPATTAIEQQTKTLEDHMKKQEEVLQNSMAALSVYDPPAIEYEKTSEIVDESKENVDTPTTSAAAENIDTPTSYASPKIFVDFDSNLAGWQRYYDKLNVPKLNDIYRNVVKFKNVEEQKETIKYMTDDILDKFKFHSSSIGGKIAKCNANIRKAINREENIEIRNGLFRQLDFISNYKDSLSAVKTKIIYPNFVDIKLVTPKRRSKRKSDIVVGSGVSLKYYNSVNDLVPRLYSLIGNIEGGNNSEDILNEATEILDILHKHEVIDTSQYKILHKILYHNK